MDEPKSGISRREALKTTAKAAGVAAFAAPVVVGVFHATASAAVCTTANDSDAVEQTVITQNIRWNTNCGQGGRYNAQNKNITLLGGLGEIRLGNLGTDNLNFPIAFYVITLPNYVCNVPADGWSVLDCPSQADVVFSGVNADDNTGPVPYCTTNCNSMELLLTKVVCCPA